MSVTEEIARIESALARGAKQITVDGLTVAVDHETMRRRLTELRAEASRARKPRISQIDLRNV